MSTGAIIPAERIEGRILLIRGHRVMLDTDLAQLYGVTTKRLNEQVKRNRERFSEDFMLRLTSKEKAEEVANCDLLHRLKFSPNLPHAFTEHGAVMLASVLNSRVAVRVSIEVVRAFIRLREAIMSHRELVQRLNTLERKYDTQFKVVFEAIARSCSHLRQSVAASASVPIAMRKPPTKSVTSDVTAGW